MHNRHSSFPSLLALAFPALLLSAACGDDQTDTLSSDSGTPNAGTATLPADDKCIGSSITADEAVALCQWGASVLGPEGTVFQAACRDIVQDAGAPPLDPSLSMVDMVVLSQANCIAKVRTDSPSGCPYVVSQFKLSVDSFKAGRCGAGPVMSSLVGYR